MAEPVTADDAFYAICRAMTVVGAGWSVRAKIHALRDRMGISEERHVAITRELQEDARVQNLKEGHHPAAPRARPAPPPPAPTPVAAPLPPLPHAPSHKSKARGQPEYGVAGRRDRISNSDPKSLIGHQVNIIQEDDSTVLVTVISYNPADRHHGVVMNYGMPDASEAQEVPLWDNPQSYHLVGEDPAWEFAPAAPVRASGGGGGGGGGSHRAMSKSGSVKRPAISSKAGGSKSGGGVPSVGGKQPPYEEAWLAGRLEAAPLTELGLMLVAIAKKEAQIHGQLSQGGCGDAEVAASIQKRLEASQQLSQAAKQASAA